MQRVLASYWHIGLCAHPRLPELLIAGRERDDLAEFQIVTTIFPLA
jgi:hypothetical protein